MKIQLKPDEDNVTFPKGVKVERTGNLLIVEVSEETEKENIFASVKAKFPNAVRLD